MKHNVDILIAGGGVAGLVATIAMADAGFDVICADPVPPVTDRAAEGADLRTTAYLQPSQDFLNQIGVWPRVASDAAALQTMRIVDASGDDPVTKDFNAADISDHPFGWNVGNWRMRAALLERITALPNATFMAGTSATKLHTRTDHAIVKLSDGQQIQARLVVAADGRDSLIRTQLGIGANRTEFGQHALTFAVTHAKPHNNISTEVHKTGGPFTLVPLPDFDGQPSSAVVWMDDSAKSKARQTFDAAVFEAEINERSAGVLGPLRLISRRTAWPIIAQLTDNFCAERTAIVAEAAHVVPPIGAQGLNMSLTDIETLRDLAVQNSETLGNATMLETYARARHNDVKLRMTGIKALNLMSKSSNPMMNTARAWGIDAIHSISPIRKTLMKMGLGAG